MSRRTVASTLSSCPIPSASNRNWIAFCPRGISAAILSRTERPSPAGTSSCHQVRSPAPNEIMRVRSSSARKPFTSTQTRSRLAITHRSSGRVGCRLAASTQSYLDCDSPSHALIRDMAPRPLVSRLIGNCLQSSNSKSKKNEATFGTTGRNSMADEMRQVFLP